LIKYANSCKIFSMLTRQRKQLILQKLRSEGLVVAKAICEELGASEDTIRRDLRELARDGQLTRVHGGAMPLTNVLSNAPVRNPITVDDNASLGKRAASLVQPGQVVILDGGGASTQLIRHLPTDLRATIVTHSPAIAVELAQHTGIDVIMLGGQLFRHSMVNVGSSTVDSASGIHADLFFMAASGVHARQGLSTGDYEEANIKRTLHRQAAQTVVMASKEKLGASAAFHIIEAKQLGTLIVPDNTPVNLEQEWSALGVNVLRTRTPL
jgi:DeoR/GlpR family transcriptional regulator of sugar metabolism